MRRIALMMLLLAATNTAQVLAQVPGLRIYVGTYTGPKSQGIYSLEFSEVGGFSKKATLAAETPSPSFLAVHPSGKYLYAANEVGSFEGKKTGSVSAFEVHPFSGPLKPLNQQPSGGADPCYVVVDPSGKNLLVANYSGGSIEVVPIGPDGKLGEPTSVIQHRGTSIDKSRQSTPHAHSIDLDASGKLAFAADLGLDKILIYGFDPTKGTLTPHSTPFATLKPGSGPRHFAFHPDGKHAYVINEIASTVTALDYDPAAGALTETQTISTRAPGGKPGNSTAEILVHPSGKFVYGSNRGDDSLVIYSVEPASGKLTLVGHQLTGGKTPRSFGIDPSGKYLFAANQGSDSLVAFKVDEATGLLKQIGEPATVPSPVCVKFAPYYGEAYGSQKAVGGK
jgi:6-phosphogluconolactonase